METSPCWLCNLRKDILYCFKNLLLFIEKITVKFLEINVKQTKFLIEIDIDT